jgi:hypothetical protein
MKQASNAKYIKIAMIPLLLGTLYFVLPKRTNAPESEPALASVVMPAQNELNPTVDSSGVRSKVAWPVHSSSEFGNADPFDRRMLFPELALQKAPSINDGSDQQVLVSANSSLDKTAACKIQAVFHSPVGIAALVGDRVVHVGDQLPDGRLVVGITAEQLVLSSSHDNSLH